MLYDNYQKRIQKIAAVLSRIIKLLPLIVSAISVVLLAVIVLLACKGMPSAVTCPAEIEYGELYACDADAFWSDVRIEYCPADSEDWSGTKPRMPGNYSVRAVGINVFGNDRYGKAAEFSILPRSVDVRVSTDRVIYGEEPEVISETAYSDLFFCDGVIFEDICKETTSVTPDVSKIRFTDPQGNDVTHAYSLNIITSDITFDKRDLSITVGSASKEYDGTPISLESYEITGGSLVGSDSVGAVFADSATDAGIVENIPEFKVFHSENGNLTDVTHHYNIRVTAGKLTVTKKPVTFITGSLEAVYTGSEFGCDDFELDAGSSLVEGHTAYLASSSSFTDCGEHKNYQVIKITDENGIDMTANYSIYYKKGTIGISPKQISVKTGDLSVVYDGAFHSGSEFSVEGLIDGHTAKAKTSSGSIKLVGKAENHFEISVSDASGRDVSSNYAITYEYGTIEITPRPVTIRTSDGKWTYDGQPHSTYTYEFTSQLTFASGDRFSSYMISEITEVGKIKNEFSRVVLISSDGTDVTNCYKITYENGTLEVTPRPITVKPDDTEKVYDSTPLYGGEIRLTEDSPYQLVEGHTIKASPSGSRTNVGVGASGVKSIKIYDGSIRDVTKNYSITQKNGTLTVTKRPIVLLTSSAEKDYDGKPLTSSKFSVPSHSPYQLVVGHRITMSITGSQTKIGESPNTCNENATKITSQGYDVTANYQITHELGVLKVNPYAVITVLTACDEKFYDGKPLTNGDYEVSVTNGKLRSGHRVVVNVTGSIINPGSTPNAATAKVVNSSGKDVTQSYELSVAPGTLKIIDKEQAQVPSNAVFGQIKTDAGGTVYLRMKSYGDYTGREWMGAVPYGKTLPGGYSYNYLTSIALRNSGGHANSAEITNCSLYMLPYYIGFEGNYDKPKTDTVYDSDMKNYTMTYYSITSSRNGYENLKGNLGEYAQYEKEYRSFVYKNYLTVDNDTRAYMEKLIAEQNFSLSDPNVIQKVASYIQGAAVYNLEYDPKLDMEENVAIAFLDEYKEGKCVHYASAGTLLFRTLGIPARYVTGFMIRTVKDKFVDIANPGHAWVEVYIDGIGWVEVEVTGSDSHSDSAGSGSASGSEGEEGEGGSGGFSGTPILELTPAYQCKTYSSAALNASNELDINGTLSDLLKEGYTYSVKITGSQRAVGRGVSTIQSFTLYDKNGNNVTDSFNIVYNEGVLEVFEKDVTIIKVALYEIQKYYDGTPLFFEEDDCEIISDTSGIVLGLSLNISLTEAGEITLAQINTEREKYASYSVTKSGRDVSSKYVVVFETVDSAKNSYVPIRVDRRIISLISATQNKIEDGSPLTNDGVTISKGSLIAGHTLEAYAIGYIDYVGTVENTIDYSNIKIYDSEGNDVSKNYSIKNCVEGSLTIVSPND